VQVRERDEVLDVRALDDLRAPDRQSKRASGGGSVARTYGTLALHVAKLHIRELVVALLIHQSLRWDHNRSLDLHPVRCVVCTLDHKKQFFFF
jgi:hypothetical protein